VQAFQPKEALQAALRETLTRCDEDYVALLELQQRELGTLLEAMQQSSSDILSRQTHTASTSAEAFLEASSELLQENPVVKADQHSYATPLLLPPLVRTFVSVNRRSTPS
jgi:hypothetical protein